MKRIDYFFQGKELIDLTKLSTSCDRKMMAQSDLVAIVAHPD
jgi:hypothetical protein